MSMKGRAASNLHSSGSGSQRSIEPFRKKLKLLIHVNKNTDLGSGKQMQVSLIQKLIRAKLLLQCSELEVIPFSLSLISSCHSLFRDAGNDVGLKGIRLLV